MDTGSFAASDDNKNSNRVGRPYLGGNGKRKPQVMDLQIFENAERIASMQKKSPLEILVEMSNDKNVEPKLRAYCASQAAPYVHRRMPVAMEHTGANGKPLAPPTLNVSFGNDKESVTTTEVVSPEEAFTSGIGVGMTEQEQNGTVARIEDEEEVTDAEVTNFKKTGT